MSIGPVLECPKSLVDCLPELVSSVGVKIEILDRVEPNGWEGQYVFKTSLGHIIGRRHVKDNICRIWLTFPREHAFNPLYWLADFRLCGKLERMLQENGASPCDWANVAS